MSTEQKHISKVSSCSACGTAPVNHRLFYIGSIAENIFEKIADFFFGWIKIPSESPITDIFMQGFVGIFQLFGLATYSDDVTKVVTGRSEMIWNEAIRRNIPMQQVIMFKKPLEQYRAKINGRWVYFQSIPIPPWLPQKGYEWIDDKFLLSEKLNSLNINSPRAKKVATFAQAQRAFNELGNPVIIKPQHGSRARHTTTNINTITELQDAYKLGKMIAHSLVVEKHLFGSVYRATIINNKLVGFFKTDPPKITGDGIHTISELIEIQNKNKPEKIFDIVVNDDIISFIGRKNYTLESIIPKGEILDVTAKTGRFLGGYTKEMLDEIHPKFHEIFERAGIAFEVSIAGFDVIVPDPTKDPEGQTWGIIECNSMPFIDLHYFAYEGPRIDLSKNIWDLWETEPKKK
ncbi:MAG: hypothetical protein WCO65_00425 [bacterium]